MSVVIKSKNFEKFMKWQESLIMILSIGGLIQLVKWTLDLINVQELTFLFSIIFTLLTISILVLFQLQKENDRIKEFLKTKGFVDDEGVFNKMTKLNNKGFIKIDARVLLFFILITILYLIWKAFLD